ncbi:PREDICTED: extensin-like [Amphimedon queenslandica]|uniref:POU domain protein n=1 Tax=Amphimedon queenslandica TaxID=400682 RepID=A0A1X7VUP1_AMPQE|nr:PREDICTED: extensin-like [Amphimedon queenslandica]|eukprot:XP_011410308.1 PREDICTED: extensin-like [Amphimedon queenslandica]
MDNHPPQPPVASSASQEWPPDLTEHDPQHGQSEDIPHSSHNQSAVDLDDTDFNLDSFLAADLDAMYAAQAAATAGGQTQEHLQSHSVPLHHHVSHSNHTVNLEQQRPHSHSIVSSSYYVPQVPSQPLSLAELHTSVTPPLRPSCRYQVHYDRPHIEQHQHYRFISEPPLQQYPQHPLNVHHHPANNYCRLHSNNQPQPLHIFHQHPAVLQQQLLQQPVLQQQLLQQPVPQQQLPQQPVPQQQLPQQPIPQRQPSSFDQILLYHQAPPIYSHSLPQRQLPQQPVPQRQPSSFDQVLLYHQAPPVYSHLLPQQQLPQQPVVRHLLPQYHQSLVPQTEFSQPVIAKPIHIVFPPIIHQLQKKDNTGNKQVLIPVSLPHANNDNSSKGSPDVPTTPVSSLPPSPLSSLPSTPYVPEPILSQPPPPPTAPTPVPGPNPDSSDSPIRASCRNVDTEGIRILNLFADKFKESRIRYEYSKQYVAQQISIQYNFEMTEQRLQLFENKVLSFEEMLAMKIHLEKWLLDALRNQGINETEIKQLSRWLTSFNQKRKGRTAISVQTKKQLLKEFENDPKPSPKDLKAISEKLGIGFEVVRVWFCNKRAKRKAGKDNDGPEDDEEIEEESDSDEESNSDAQSSQ